MNLQGETINDRYLVGEELGQGGDATVYRAQDLHLGRDVAIKLLRPELQADPTFVARFEREAHSVALLDHPHIIPVYEYGEALGTHYLVMQYVSGGDLRARLREGPLVVDHTVQVARDVAEALGAAHAHGIVHRDVKPANILLTEDGRAKVTDFGIAKMLDVPALTATAALLGTPHYLAPEQASGAGVTPATDVYALGVVLFEMLIGRHLFEGESFVQVAMQHLHTPPPDLAALNPAVPDWLAALVNRALAKDPAERFADGAALAAALQAEDGQLPESAAPIAHAPAAAALDATAPRHGEPAAVLGPREMPDGGGPSRAVTAPRGAQDQGIGGPPAPPEPTTVRLGGLPGLLAAPLAALAHGATRGQSDGAAAAAALAPPGAARQRLGWPAGRNTLSAVAATGVVALLAAGVIITRAMGGAGTSTGISAAEVSPAAPPAAVEAPPATAAAVQPTAAPTDQAIPGRRWRRGRADPAPGADRAAAGSRAAD
jgi:serine/threonine-protein kinase